MPEEEDDPRLLELAVLVQTRKLEWSRHGADCLHLLAPIPGHVKKRGEALKMLLGEVVERAYVDAKAGLGDDAIWVLTAGALVGLITSSPDDYSRATAMTGIRRQENKTKRKELAGEWFDISRRRLDEKLCLRAFVRAIDAFTEDDEAMEGFRRRLSVSVEPQRPRDSVAPVAEESPKPQADRPQYQAVAKFPPLPAFDTAFVDRPAIEERYNTLLDDGTQLVAFVGEPGNGKSRLAQELTVRRAGRNGSLLFLNGGQIMSQMAGLLAQNGVVSGYDLTAEQITLAFAAYLSSPTAPDFVVLDDIANRGLLEALAPPTVKPTVVVTSRTNVLPPGRGESIVVREMEDDEAVQMVRNLGGPARLSEVRRIVDALGARPLAIEHACTGLLAGGYMTVKQFCEALQHDVGTTLKKAQSAEDVDKTLTWIYEQILTRLRSLDADAAKLLELAAFVAPTAIPEPLLQAAFSSCRDAENDAEIAVAFQAAQRDLQSYYLINRSIVQDGVDRPDSGRQSWFRPVHRAVFSMHSLTQELLRSILTKEGRSTELCLKLHGSLGAQLASNPRKEYFDPDSISDEDMHWLPHAYMLASGLHGSADDVYQEVGFGATLAFLIKGALQNGDPEMASQASKLYPGLGDQQTWQRAPYMYEAYVEYLKMQYHMSALQSSEFARAIAHVNVICGAKSDVPGKLNPPRPIRLLEWIEAVVDDGRYTDALELSEVFDEIYRPSGSVPNIVLVRRVMLLSEIYVAQCRWSDAEAALAAAHWTYTEHHLGSWAYIREQFRLFIADLEYCHISGQPDRASTVESYADQRWASKANDYYDCLTEGRYYYVKARCAVVVATRFYVEHRPDSGYEAAYAERLNGLLKIAYSYIDRCRAAYTKVGRFRQTYELYADMVLCYFLVGSGEAFKVGRRIIDEWYERDHLRMLHRGTWRAQARFALLAERMRIMTTSLSRDPAIVVNWKRQNEFLAEALGIRLGSPYLYAEFLGISSIYDQLRGQPHSGKLREIVATYRSIGRLDRWEALAEALASLPQDRTTYLKKMRYLLLP
ncbi:ATP-binding protein [Fodinicola acaciae]|uniref:ATP-binding protein n=1 Tax=Fodinicola acaciae TaxID=2681555 RepID=UPI0013D3E5EF|nr:ATP-binding protein [Fodinicola acaciae]